jgi:hypothetical protein
MKKFIVGVKMKMDVYGMERMITRHINHNVILK